MTELVLVDIPYPASEVKDDSVTVNRVRALWDLEATQEEQLTLKKGDIVIVLNQSDEVPGWWYGELDEDAPPPEGESGGEEGEGTSAVGRKQRGMFPKNYVEVVEIERLIKRKMKVDRSKVSDRIRLLQMKMKGGVAEEEEDTTLSETAVTEANGSVAAGDGPATEETKTVSEEKNVADAPKAPTEFEPERAAKARKMREARERRRRVMREEAEAAKRKAEEERAAAGEDGEDSEEESGSEAESSDEESGSESEAESEEESDSESESESEVEGEHELIDEEDIEDEMANEEEIDLEEEKQWERLMVRQLSMSGSDREAESSGSELEVTDEMLNEIRLQRASRRRRIRQQRKRTPSQLRPRDGPPPPTPPLARRRVASTTEQEEERRAAASVGAIEKKDEREEKEVKEDFSADTTKVADAPEMPAAAQDAVAKEEIVEEEEKAEEKEEEEKEKKEDLKEVVKEAVKVAVKEALEEANEEKEETEGKKVTKEENAEEKEEPPMAEEKSEETKEEEKEEKELAKEVKEVTIEVEEMKEEKQEVKEGKKEEVKKEEKKEERQEEKKEENEEEVEKVVEKEEKKEEKKEKQKEMKKDVEKEKKKERKEEPAAAAAVERTKAAAAAETPPEMKARREPATVRHASSTVWEAVVAGDLEFLRRFLAADTFKVMVNGRNEKGQAALHMAVLANQKEVCELLVREGASLSVLDRNNCMPHRLSGCTPEIRRAILANACVQPTWVPDNTSDQCLLCDCKFSFFHRRHHCRNCGVLACSHCCSAKRAIPNLEIPDAVRVCVDCADVLE